MSSLNDEDDPEVQMAIAMSMEPNNSSDQSTSKGKEKMKTDALIAKNQFVDHKALHEERTRRKRLMAGNDSTRTDEDGRDRSHKKTKLEIIDLETTEEASSSGQTDPEPAKTYAAKAMNSFAPGSFLKGTIKRTWAFGCDRDDDIKFEEVLQKNDLKMAVFSSFVWDTEWFFSKFDEACRMYFIMGLYSTEDQVSWKEDAEKNYKFLRLCFPDLTGQTGCMHSKLMLLSYTNHLRIVLPTANLTKYDWGETGGMENLVFMIDLPRLQGSPVAEEQLTKFGKELMYYLEAMGLEDGARRSLLKFDFSETSNIAFVHTIAGSHFDENARRTGLPGLARAVRQLSQESDNSLVLDYASASVGSLNDRTLQALYTASMGKDIMSGSFNAPQQHARSKTNIYFPSHNTVANSKGGTNGAGVITLRTPSWESENFPKDRMRDHVSTRPGLLSHGKLILARGRKGDRTTAWCYIGSANLSDSAWGRVVRDRARKVPKLNCKNWESGVLVPVPKETLDSINFEELNASVPIEAFDSILKRPFEYPGNEYGPDGHAWLFADYHPG